MDSAQKGWRHMWRRWCAQRRMLEFWTIFYDSSKICGYQCYTAFHRNLIAQSDTQMICWTGLAISSVSVAMVDLEPVVWNFTHNGSGTNESVSGYPNDEFYNIVHVTETKILPAFVGFLCSTGLVGNVLVLVTILRYVSGYMRRNMNWVQCLAHLFHVYVFFLCVYMYFIRQIGFNDYLVYICAFLLSKEILSVSLCYYL